MILKNILDSIGNTPVVQLNSIGKELECELFAKYVLPQLKTISLPDVFNRRINETPDTPLGKGERK